MLGKIGHLCVAMLVAAFIFSVFVVLSGVNTAVTAITSDMVYGRAHKPYVYRVLLPTTARAIAEVTPTDLKSDINGSLAKTDFVRSIPDLYFVDNNYLYEDVLVGALMFISLVGFIYSMRYFTASVYQISDKTNNLVSLVAVLLIVQGFVYGYIYDFSALFLTTLAYGLLARNKLLPYILLFPFVTLNKETSVLLIPVYWLHFHTMEDKRTFYAYFIIQIVIFIIIKVGLFWAFQDNSGGSVEFYLTKHFTEYNRILRTYPMGILYYGIILIGTPLLMFYRWDEKPIFLKRASLMIGPLFFLYLVLGYPLELRVFYEIYPVIFLLVLHTLGSLRGYSIREPVWDPPKQFTPISIKT